MIDVNGRDHLALKGEKASGVAHEWYLPMAPRMTMGLYIAGAIHIVTIGYGRWVGPLCAGSQVDVILRVDESLIGMDFQSHWVQMLSGH